MATNTERTLAMAITSVDTTGKAKPIMAYVNNVTENEVEFGDDKYHTKLSVGTDYIGVTVTKLYKYPINEGNEDLTAKGAKDACDKVVAKLQELIANHTWTEVLDILVAKVAQ